MNSHCVCRRFATSASNVRSFSNRWYADALRTAVAVTLPRGLKLKAITAPYILRTKIEAFRGRGHDDYFGSHDLEDFITVIDGRPSLLKEVGKPHLISRVPWKGRVWASLCVALLDVLRS